MRKYLVLTMALGALIAVSVAGIAMAAQDTVVRAGNLVVTIDGSSGLTPKALSKSKYTPVAFTAAGNVRTTDGTQVPPVKEVLINAKNVAVNTKGYPICTSGQLQARDTAAVKKACPNAIIGEGTTKVSVAFPEQPPIPATSPLLVFNGGTAGGVTTLYIHAYLTQPITTAIVTTVKIKKSGSGISSVTTIPKIANGAGSVTDFSLKIDKKYTYKGQKISVLSAKCVGGKIQAHVTTKFYDNSQLSADVLRTCTSKP
jgi:hypothetical protein